MIKCSYKFHPVSGYGSVGTASAMLLPYSVAEYLTNVSHMDTGQQMSLERRWQDLNEHSGEVEHRCDIETRIENGARVKDEYNE